MRSPFAITFVVAHDDHAYDGDDDDCVGGGDVVIIEQHWVGQT